MIFITRCISDIFFVRQIYVADRYGTVLIGAQRQRHLRRACTSCAPKVGRVGAVLIGAAVTPFAPLFVHP